MDGVELDLICPCGYENFERIVVQRKPHPPIVTDFVACVGCKTMYFSPVPRPGSRSKATRGRHEGDWRTRDVGRAEARRDRRIKRLSQARPVRKALRPLAPIPAASTGAVWKCGGLVDPRRSSAPSEIAMRTV